MTQRRLTTEELATKIQTAREFLRIVASPGDDPNHRHFVETLLDVFGEFALDAKRAADALEELLIYRRQEAQR